MDHETRESQPRRSGSFGRLSSASSSRIFTIESETVSEAGDIGDRALQRNRYCSTSGISDRFSFDNSETGTVFPIQDDPSTTDAIIQSRDGNKDEREVPWSLEYVTCLLLLAVFGILGVLARYGLQKFFGLEGIGATSDESYM